MQQKNDLRVYFLAEREFPSGNAGGIRVQYMAKALQLLGYEVIVISLGDNNAQDYVKELNGFVYDGIQYENYPLYKGIKRFFRRYIFSGLAAIAKLKRFSNLRTSKDVVIVYTSNALYAMTVLFYLRHRYSVWMDVVEWFQKENFNYQRLNIKYWLYRFCFNVLYPATKQVIAISSLIENEFKCKGCKTILIPNLYDTSIGDRYSTSHNYDIINLIYSGNPGIKENLSSMFKALIELPETYRLRYKFHFTGVRKEEVLKLLGQEAPLLQGLKEILIFHSWMEYENLLAFYSKMNFLYFVRDPTTPNLANFPTKLPELMTFGVVPLTTQIGDYGKYLVDGVNSILIDNSHYLTCKESLLRVLSLSPSQIQQLSAGAKKCAKENFEYRVRAKTIDFEVMK